MQVSQNIESLIPYAPGKPIEETRREFGLQTVYKLASNENPLGPSAKVLQAIERAASEIHRYPDASCYNLVQELSQKFLVSPEQIVCGNGSNELIDLMIRVFCSPGDRILTSENTFIAYQICAQAANVGVKTFPMAEGLKFDMKSLTDYIRNSASEKDKLVFIANPNNPTGTSVSHAEMRELLTELKKQKKILVLDEAYTEFARDPQYPRSIELLKEFPETLVILRTMAKAYGLAGLRIGFMMASATTCDYVHRVRHPFNVNSIAQEAAIAALRDRDYLQRSQECVWQGLDYFYKELKNMGLPYIESQANFVLFDTLVQGEQVAQALLRKGIILRALKGYKLPQYLRMSVGLKHENEAAIQALKEVLRLTSID